MCTGLHKIHLSSPYQTTTICSQTMKFNIFPKMLSFVNPVLEAIKMAMASVASIALLGFAGLTVAGSTAGLVVSTPLFIIFSPILVPATIATTLLATGLTAGASLGGMALGLIIWLIKSSASYKGGKRPSAQTLLPFFGTSADKPADGATPPAGGAAPPAGGADPPAGGAAPPASGGAAPAGGRVIPAILGSVKWTWTRDGNPFSGGWFGGTPADGGESVGASSPGVVLQWSWTSLRGKKYSGKLPFAVIPTGGGKPAAAPSAE